MENNETPRPAIGLREATESLAAVRDVETRARDIPVPWGLISLVGIFMGLGAGAALAGSFLGLAAFLLALGLVIYVEQGSRQPVRASMKQDPHADEGRWSWKSALAFLAVYTVVYVGMQVFMHYFPDGNATAGVVVGVLTAAAMTLFYGLTWRRFH
ncbi:hypothetical protein [Corynebacterium timonense]|uniref:Uncharacterized protein n=1 Tax=Corynebacterium timonense TaxID=441500 RepID=A0A1H1RAN4_9CORY|nr:hypothetical protein [Corynebacterium timonense]SDS32725.1 hypothetical protein SAMN04488539_1453 [Corynebacterium timonense]